MSPPCGGDDTASHRDADTAPHRDADTAPHGEDGNALVEFTVLAVLLMVPLVYVLLTAFEVQRAAFAVTEAARQAGRAYVLAGDPATGRDRAELASGLALSDQGLAAQQPPEISDPDALAPGSRVVTTVRYVVDLPVLRLLPDAVEPQIPVSARHVEVVDTFQAGP